MKDILALITKSYSPEEADHFASHKITTTELDRVIEAGRKVLDIFPHRPFCCTYMSAYWAAILRDNFNIPAHVVVGSLTFKQRKIFGGDFTAKSLNDAFLNSDTPNNLDVHCWIIIGDHIGDISFFRTAYSQNTNKWLKSETINTFGEGRGIILGTSEQLLQNALTYNPIYILTDMQITGLCKATELIIRNSII